jgi:hypothetical protein
MATDNILAGSLAQEAAPSKKHARLIIFVVCAALSLTPSVIAGVLFVKIEGRHAASEAASNSPRHWPSASPETPPTPDASSTATGRP